MTFFNIKTYCAGLLTYSKILVCRVFMGFKVQLFNAPEKIIFRLLFLFTSH